MLGCLPQREAALIFKERWAQWHLVVMTLASVKGLPVPSADEPY